MYTRGFVEVDHYKLVVHSRAAARRFTFERLWNVFYQGFGRQNINASIWLLYIYSFGPHASVESFNLVIRNSITKDFIVLLEFRDGVQNCSRGLKEKRQREEQV